MKNVEMKRKGFTLVELLIVIVVIGILSAMMMLSSTEAVSSARASNIVSNLRNLKTAALSYYVDNVDTYDVSTVENANKLEQEDVRTKILKYMSTAAEQVGAEYGFVGDDPATWYVYYNVTNDQNVKDKLTGRANSTGLRGADNINGFTSGDAPGVYKGQDYVGMFIR